MYEEIIVNCFRYLGFTSLYDIEVLTFYEYSLRMRAFNLSEVDKKYNMHLQAWLNHQVQATKEQGKKQVSVYKKFTDFFDYDKHIREIEGHKKSGLTKRQKEIARKVAKLNSL